VKVRSRIPEQLSRAPYKIKVGYKFYHKRNGERIRVTSLNGGTREPSVLAMVLNGSRELQILTIPKRLLYTDYFFYGGPGDPAPPPQLTQPKEAVEERLLGEPDLPKLDKEADEEEPERPRSMRVPSRFPGTFPGDTMEDGEKRVTAATVNAEFKRRGYPERIVQAKDYVYFNGGNTSSWTDTMAGGVFRVGQLSVAQWVELLDRMRAEYERWR
jgi:hypothetical protein